MDSRREPRFTIHQPVVVTVLTSPPVWTSARVDNASRRGLRLLVGQRIPAGAAIRIEIEDAIVLGEAVYCRQEAGGWSVGVTLDQILTGIEQWHRKLAGRRREPASAQAPQDAAESPTSACGRGRNLP